MNRTFSAIAGVSLLIVGGMALLFNFALSFMGLRFVLWGVESLPVIGLGLVFLCLPVLIGKPWAGAFFIPGMPILATGSMLLLQNLIPNAWSLFWPVEPLALAAGFLLAAAWMRLFWLVIPAILVGVNGLALAFCNLTGLWGAWSFLWAIEPLAVGVILTLVGIKERSAVLIVIGASLCAFAGMAGLGMLALTSGLWKLLGTAMAIALLAGGAALVVWSFVSGGQKQEPASNM